jgi:hypothetical protein
MTVTVSEGHKWIFISELLILRHGIVRFMIDRPNLDNAVIYSVASKVTIFDELSAYTSQDYYCRPILVFSSPASMELRYDLRLSAFYSVLLEGKSFYISK